jgi:hypothetical protein
MFTHCCVGYLECKMFKVSATQYIVDNDEQQSGIFLTSLLVE